MNESVAPPVSKPPSRETDMDEVKAKEAKAEVHDLLIGAGLRRHQTRWGFVWRLAENEQEEAE